MTRRIAITGANGFVGRYLADEITKSRDIVVPLSRATTDYTLNSLTQSLMGVDTVVHLAGRRMTRNDNPNDLAPFIDPNVLLSGRLMQAAIACDVPRFVFASTIALYSPQGETPYNETTQLCPINAYALSKQMGEDYLALMSRASKVNLVSLRFAAIYGHGEKGTPALMRFVNQASVGDQITLTGNANYGIDQLYIRDAVHALNAATQQKAAAGTYNIGSGQVFGVRTLAQTVNSVFDNDGNLDDSAAQDGPLAKSFMDIRRAKQGLRWQPTYDLQSGLEDLRQTRHTQKD